jgi:hypothetical protein
MAVLTRGLVVITMVAVACSQGPPPTRDITIVNGTGYDLTVEVSDDARGAWLPVATVEAGSERLSQEVLDQGDVWVFRFLRAGEPIGELSLDRTELERDNWRIEVPDDVRERLENLEPSPN